MLRLLTYVIVSALAGLVLAQPAAAFSPPKAEPAHAVASAKGKPKSFAASAAALPSADAVAGMQDDRSAQMLLRQLHAAARNECTSGSGAVRAQCVTDTMERAVRSYGSVVLSANFDRYVNAGANFGRAFLRPRLISGPSGPELARYYPAEARGRTGTVRLDCTVQADLHATCSVISGNARFADAARQVSQRFRARSTFADGASTVGARTTVTLRFETGDV